MKIWILTCEYNDYDQHGEYFVCAYLNKPIHQQLTDEAVQQHRLRHVLDGGGRVDDEYKWFYLRNIELS